MAANQHYIDVPLYNQQPEEWACAAFCAKTIAEYYKQYYSIAQIYAWAFPGENVQSPYPGIHKDIIVRVLRDNMRLPVQEYGDMQFNEFMDIIYSDTPMLGISALASTSSYWGHTIVMRGYMKYFNSTTHIGAYSFMNPRNGTYQAGSVSNSQEYTYVDISGYNRVIQGFVPVYKPV